HPENVKRDALARTCRDNARRHSRFWPLPAERDHVRHIPHNKNASQNHSHDAESDTPEHEPAFASAVLGASSVLGPALLATPLVVFLFVVFLLFILPRFLSGSIVLVFRLLVTPGDLCSHARFRRRLGRWHEYGLDDIGVGFVLNNLEGGCCLSG